MKAYPKRLAGEWVKAKCDPDGKVEFQVQRLPNSLQVHIATELMRELGQEPANAEVAYEALRYALVGVRGLEDPDTGKEFELAKDTVKVRGETFTRIRTYSLDRLPGELLAEMIVAVSKIAEPGLTEKEREDLGFTAVSSRSTSKSARATR